MHKKERRNQPGESLLSELEDLRRRMTQLEGKLHEDIEHIREQEQVMMQQSKLAAMGQMLTAIAHQWRQPLTTIAFIFQNIKSAYKLGKLDEPYLETAVDEAMEHIEFMSDTIDECRDFLKPGREENNFEMLLAVNKVLSLLDSQIRHNAVVVKFNNDLTPPVMLPGHMTEFQRVLINIINNGIFAIQKRTEKGELDKEEGELTIDIYRRGRRVHLDIANNGDPIPEKILDRIFEPFYSTKDHGKGMGVGLYMAQIIIERNMGGSISCRNHDGKVMFSIQLDMYEEEKTGKDKNAEGDMEKK